MSYLVHNFGMRLRHNGTPGFPRIPGSRIAAIIIQFTERKRNKVWVMSGYALGRVVLTDYNTRCVHRFINEQLVGHHKTCSRVSVYNTRCSFGITESNQVIFSIPLFYLYNAVRNQQFLHLLRQIV